MDGQYVVELYGSWIIGTVEMDVDVTDDIRYIGSMSGDTRSSKYIRQTKSVMFAKGVAPQEPQVFAPPTYKYKV